MLHERVCFVRAIHSRLMKSRQVLPGAQPPSGSEAIVAGADLAAHEYLALC